MKVKKAAKQPAQASIGSNGIIKKKTKKKVKSPAQKLANTKDVTEGVETAGATVTSSLDPKINKLKKKNKNKKKPSSTVNGLSNAKESQMKDECVNLQKPAGNTLKVTNTDTPVNSILGSASSKTKKAKKKKQGISQASVVDSSANPKSVSQNGTSTGKKSKKSSKPKKAREELSNTSESNEEREQRTIFVGNVSTKTTRKRLARFFSKYGKVETVRLRCAAVPTPATTKRQAVIMNTFHEKRTSLSAYVRFTEPTMVDAALKANGAELDQKHLLVDRSQGTTNRNTKLAVFIGNLAFEAEEEALRSHFASCGEIESVRIVRDKKLASGKGFGYVNFTSEDAVEMALQMDGQVFMHRQLRVQRCAKQAKKPFKPRFKTQGKKGLAFMKTKPTTAKSSKKQHGFSGKKMMETKKFKKMKSKAKFTKEDRKKKAIAHKLTGSKPKSTP